MFFCRRRPIRRGISGDQPRGAFVVATTLTDAAEYTADDLAELYHARWLAELDIRAIKITLGMDILRCKTPQMVRKEMWTCLLAYNLVR
ncbi:MAG TPA: transposase, partial [Phycisphaerae bacterium]|nr:transposase [Phycisphaerae bacterium]